MTVKHALRATSSSSRFVVVVDGGEEDIIAGEVKRGSLTTDGAKQYGWRAFGPEGEPLGFPEELHRSKDDAAAVVVERYAGGVGGASPEPEPTPEPTPAPEPEPIADLPQADKPSAGQSAKLMPGWTVEHWNGDTGVVINANESVAAVRTDAGASLEWNRSDIVRAEKPAKEPKPVAEPEPGALRPFTARLKADLEIPGLGKGPQHVTIMATDPEDAAAKAKAQGFGAFRTKFKLDEETEAKNAKAKEKLREEAPKGRGPRAAQKRATGSAARLKGLIDMKALGLDKFTLRRKLEREADAYKAEERKRLTAIMERRTNFYHPEEMELIIGRILFSERDRQNLKAKKVIDSGAFRRGEKGTLDIAVWHSEQNKAKAETAAAKLAELRKGSA